MSFTATISRQTASDFTESIIMFLLPGGGVIYDPTSGIKNYQFKWIKNSKLDGIKYEYISSDIKKTRHSQFLADLRHVPLREKCADLVWYDPPYMPHARSDKRGEEYGIADSIGPDAVRGFYSADIFRQLSKVARKYVCVKGSDWYYPATSSNLTLFSDLVASNMRNYMIITGLYLYRFTYGNLALYRHKIKASRPIITHTYVAVGLVH